jgi:hypothetical protein
VFSGTNRAEQDVPPGQLLEGLRAIYPPEKEALGVVALEIEPERSRFLS